MLRLETDPSEIAFAAQDTSELMVVHRIVQGLEGNEALKVRVDRALGKVIASEMIPEQEPLYGEEAALVFGQLARIAQDRHSPDNPAAKQMMWEFHNPFLRTYALGLQRKREEELIRAGEPSIAEKLRPVKAWRADSANHASTSIDMSSILKD